MSGAGLLSDRGNTSWDWPQKLEVCCNGRQRGKGEGVGGGGGVTWRTSHLMRLSLPIMAKMPLEAEEAGKSAISFF